MWIDFVWCFMAMYITMLYVEIIKTTREVCSVVLINTFIDVKFIQRRPDSFIILCAFKIGSVRALYVKFVITRSH